MKLLRGKQARIIRRREIIVRLETLLHQALASTATTDKGSIDVEFRTLTHELTELCARDEGGIRIRK